MKTRIVTILAVLALGISAHAANTDYSRISFVKPGVNKAGPMDPSRYIKLVVEGASVFHDKVALPAEGLRDHINKLLETTGADYLAIYVREGVKYGDVVRAVDILRMTNAKNIAVNTDELPLGRDV
jgi:biopolymer transport protein ExbD